MIQFHNIRFKNFLSSGSEMIDISLDQVGNTLIIGDNGAGKSTMLDAISFALYNKPHRGVTKGGLINSVNKKGMVVEIEFTTNGHRYHVIRGSKPNVFEIRCDGELIEAPAHSNDYQRILEEEILCLPQKTFQQVVVLGSSNFVPFMQLPAANRRTVIEDLLDLTTIGEMQVKFKERLKALKADITDNGYTLSAKQREADMLERHLADLKVAMEATPVDNSGLIKSLNDQITDLTNRNLVLFDEIQPMGNLSSHMRELNDKVSHQSQVVRECDMKLRHLMESGKYLQNSECPTCNRPIGDDLRKEKAEECFHEATEIEKRKSEAVALQTELNSQLADVNSQYQHLSDKQRDYRDNERTVSTLQNQLQSLAMQSSAPKKTVDTTETVERLQEARKALSELQETKVNLDENMRYMGAIQGILADGGLKANVVRTYLPMINELINRNLETLDFWVKFDMDEEFNETIKSRHRDDFTYSNFSEGEKQRIDLSILFAWREIARRLNSVSTNLLILDEVFDSSLDFDGTQNLTKIFKSLPDDTNIVVISHKRSELDGLFERKLVFKKEGHFSSMSEES